MRFSDCRGEFPDSFSAKLEIDSGLLGRHGFGLFSVPFPSSSVERQNLRDRCVVRQFLLAHGTLRDVDLVEAFHSELEWQISRQERTAENRDELDKLSAVLGECGDECWDADGNVVEDGELLGEWINERLIDALNAFAAPYRGARRFEPRRSKPFSHQ